MLDALLPAHLFALTLASMLHPGTVLAALSLLALGTLTMPNVGEGKALEFLVNKSAPANLVLILFSNNVTPTNATVLGDLTEMSGGGYSSVTLTGASWTVTPGSPSLASYAEQVFAFSSVPGTPTVYGYAIKSGTTLIAVERLPSAPFTVASAGDEVKITPQITLASNTND